MSWYVKYVESVRNFVFCVFFAKALWDDQSGPLPADYAEGRLFRAAVWHPNGLNSNSGFMAVDLLRAGKRLVKFLCKTL